MSKLRLLTGVGFLGFAGGLLPVPASASDPSNQANEDISLEAQGTFVGFRSDAPAVSLELPDPAAMADYIALRSSPNARVDLTLEAPNLSDYRANTGTPGNDAIQPEIFVRDDVGLPASFDADDTQPSVVQIFSQDNVTGDVFLNCTGSVINPRTILTAAHCLNFNSSEAYGLPEIGAATTMLIATGADTSSRLFNYLATGAGYAEGGLAQSTDVVIHPSANLDDGGLPFPFADIALIAVDQPITDVPILPILLTPLTELTRVVQVGYGSFGAGLGGPPADATILDSLLRRVGENDLGALASFADFDDVVFANDAPNAVNFGSSTQPYYWTDFDFPDRDAFGLTGCNFNGNGPECATLGDIISTDWFDGDALPNEVGTAPGDSGSPLIVPDLYDQPVNIAVLSGGVSFFREFLNATLGFDNTYGDISFYNPIYPFFQFISENTSYKYVSAKAGSGNWSDPNRWTQDLDPTFLIDDGTGNLVNGLPEGEEAGIFSVGDSIGIILGTDIADFPDIVSPFGPQPGDPNFGGNLPESSALLGPGSTGFVAQNTDGSPGQSFENPAQYFEVHLNKFGVTNVDIDVEIDKLVLDNGLALFNLPEERTFNTIIGYEQFAGTARIDGQFNAGLVALMGGLLTGEGTVASEVVFNIGAGVAPGGLFGIGTLTIDGDYVQASDAALLVNTEVRRRQVTNDLLSITGDASLAGNLIVAGNRRLRFADEFAVLAANTIAGGFDETFLVTFSPLLFAESRVEGGEVIVDVKARRLRDLFSSFRNLKSLGAALDTLRFDGRFNEFVGLFDVIDGAGVNALVPTLQSLTPISAFGQSTVATNFSQRFTGQISQRTLALRGGNRAANTFSAAGAGQVSNIAQVGGAEIGKLGFFGTVSGQYLVTAQERNTGRNALEESAFMQAGELTLGADLRMSENLTIGFAMTSIQNSAPVLGFRQRADDTSLSGAVYAALQSGQMFTDVYMGFSRQSFGVERASQGNFALLYDSARGEAQGRQQFGGARVGYAFGLAPGVKAGPVASVDYVRSDLGGFSEFGAGDFGLTVLDRTFTSVGAKAGMMASLETGMGRKGLLTAFGSVAYARELADTQDIVTAAFLSAKDVPFTVVNQLDPNWVSLSAGFDFTLGSHFSVGLSGQSDMGRGVLTNNQGRVNFNWKF
ncbi:autotransporter domain-containing protein [Erythrobacter sp.]|jgi:outer membrane autotransporter protein|uniref:autotransporter domain-containing protein n=1 Tax=Erythrobacter sp. TaxID=1042 RepID=UPI002EB6A128|nr:autotransporter domain-containing protein [Erythrobacter sp.]